jgi:TatA/E family protein of Tat protein translocase
MFGSLGFQELMVIFIIALIVFGPRKLPEIGRSIGKALGEFKRATNDLKSSIEDEVRADDRRSTEMTQLPTSTVPSAPAEPIVSRDSDVVS